MNTLDKEPRTLRKTYDETYAQMREVQDEMAWLYRRLNTLGDRHVALEERAATLGDELARRAK